LSSSSPQPINSEVSALDALINSQDQSIRFQAAWWLGKHRIYRAGHILCECLKDEKDRTALGGYPLRRQAARSLGLLKFKDAVPELIEALKCSDSKVQEAAILALKDIGDASAANALTEFLCIQTANKPYEALIETLAAFKAWNAKEQIEPFLLDKSERINGAAAAYFYSLTSNPFYLEKLQENLGNENPFVRNAAAFDLATLGKFEAAATIINANVPNNIKLATLKQILESILPSKQEAAKNANKNGDFLLQTIDNLTLDAVEGNIQRMSNAEIDKQAADLQELTSKFRIDSKQAPDSISLALIEATKSSHTKVKAAAIQGLIDLAPISIHAITESLENDKDQDLQACLIQALAIIGDPKSLPLFEKAIGLEIANHCQGKIRRVAARGLGKIASEAKDEDLRSQAIKKLQWTLKNPDDWALRYSAVISLESIKSSEIISILKEATKDESDLTVQTRIKKAVRIAEKYKLNSRSEH